MTTVTSLLAFLVEPDYLWWTIAVGVLALALATGCGITIAKDSDKDGHNSSTSSPKQPLPPGRARQSLSTHYRVE